MKKILFCLLLFCGVMVQSHSPKTDYKVSVTLVEQDTIPVLNRENLEKELIRRDIPHHKIVLAQSILETGHFTSKYCRERNNIFGMRNKKGYKYYKSWIECVDDYEQRFSKRYKGGDYFAFLRKCNYAEDPAYEKKVRSVL